VASHRFIPGLRQNTASLPIPDIIVGHEFFSPRLKLHRRADRRWNRIEILLNGDATFPAMLRDIKTAKSTITFAQYLYEDGSISYELAEAFSDRCRAGVQVHILIDSQGSGKSRQIPAIMRDAKCHVEFFANRSASSFLALETLEIQLPQSSARPGDRWRPALRAATA